MAATVIHRIEKDFYLNDVVKRRIPLRFRFNRQEYTLTAENDPQSRLYLQADRPVTGLRPGNRMDLLFDFYGTIFQLTVKAETIRGKVIVGDRGMDVLRKDLGRSFVRVAPSEGLRAAFAFQEERYALKFPRVRSYEPVRRPPGAAEGRNRDLKGAIEELNAWAASAADGCKAAIFNTPKLRRLEEWLVARTGLAFYLSSPEAGLGEEADREGGLLTGEQFLREVERLGYEPAAGAELLKGLMKGKADRGIASEVWAPIRFQEYVLGYVYLWTTRGGKGPLDYQAVERAAGFTREIAYAFKDGGRLENRRARNDAFEVRVLDISASGLRFCYPPGKPGLNLPPGVEMGVTLETPGRRVRARAEIVRRVSGPAGVEMSGRFLVSGADDQRLLFEYLYGESFSAGRQPFLAGKV